MQSNYIEGYNDAKEKMKSLIEKQIEDVENETININRHMNDLEYGAYIKLLATLDLVDSI